MKKCIFLMILLCSSCSGKVSNQIESEKQMINFYEKYNIYKIRKITRTGKNENREDIDNIKDRCIISYFSKEIKKKKTNYQEYILSLPINNTDKYDELIIDLTIKSSGSLTENWNFMHKYLNNIKEIDRIFERLNEYNSDDIYSFFLVYFKGYEAPYLDIFDESNYFEEETKKINKYSNLKKELQITNKKFIEYENWETEIESKDSYDFLEWEPSKEIYGKNTQEFSIDISHSMSLNGSVYDEKNFIIFLVENIPYHTITKIIYRENMDILNTRIYTYGSNFFIIKKSGSEFILTKYEYNIRESKLKILDKAKLENCF